MQKIDLPRKNIDPKFIINMKIEGSYGSYAKLAHRLLSTDRAEQI